MIQPREAAAGEGEGILQRDPPLFEDQPARRQVPPEIVASDWLKNSGGDGKSQEEVQDGHAPVRDRASPAGADHDASFLGRKTQVPQTASVTREPIPPSTRDRGRYRKTKRCSPAGTSTARKR